MIRRIHTIQFQGPSGQHGESITPLSQLQQHSPPSSRGFPAAGSSDGQLFPRGRWPVPAFPANGDRQGNDVASDGPPRPHPGGDLPPATRRRRPRPCLRRLATDRSFLRRFRRLHAPPLLGFLDRDGFHPAVTPHPSAPAARALSLAADFTFSFLPSNCRWSVRDVRDGRVLLDRQLEKGEDLPVFTQLVVCDPLHRRYILLPPVPDDVAASVKDPVPIFFGCICDPILIPPSEEEEMAAVEETAFRVIWLARCKIKFYIFVLSSSTGHWRVAASHSLTDLLGESTMMTLMHPLFIGCYHACGCIYWQLSMDNSGTEFLVLDTQRMEFSIADHPPKGWNTGGLGIVEAGEDRLGMFRIIAETAEADLRYIIGGNRGLSSTQWQAEKTISLDSKYRYCVEASSGRYLLLDRRRVRSYENYSLDGPQMEYFSLDVETLQLERVWGKPISGTSLPHLYINFTPSLLSSPTV